MRIEAIDKINAVDDDGSPINMQPGDVKTVGDNFGRLACQLGWSTDTEGKIATGTKSTDPVTVSPSNTIVDSDT